MPEASWPVDDVDKHVHKPSPAAVSVHRKTGEVRIHWTLATDADFLRVLRPLVGIGEAVLELEDKKRPEAAPPASDQGKSSSKDS